VGGKGGGGRNIERWEGNEISGKIRKGLQGKEMVNREEGEKGD